MHNTKTGRLNAGFFNLRDGILYVIIAFALRGRIKNELIYVCSAEHFHDYFIVEAAAVRPLGSISHRAPTAVACSSWKALGLTAQHAKFFRRGTARETRGLFLS